LLAWAGSPIGPAEPTPLSQINAQTGKAVATHVQVSGHIHCLAASPTNPWVAAGCACGEWKTQIWNRANGKLVMDIPQPRAVEQVCFSQDGRTLLSLSQSRISIVDLAGSGSINTVDLPEGGRSMEIHPAGEYLGVETQGMFSIVHLPTRTVLKCLWIPEPPGPRRDILEFAASRGTEGFLASLKESLSAEEMELQHGRMIRHFLPKQVISSLSFGPSGNHLFCGTGSGVCALAWDKILATADMAPIEPLVFIRAEKLDGEDEISNLQLIHAVPVDPVGRRVLYAGLEGKVRFLNIADGRVGDLLTPPIRSPFGQLELTPDRTALVGTAMPTRDGRSKPEPPSFQIWNYKALCDAADLAW
jgi:hypothetical protein